MTDRTPRISAAEYRLLKGLDTAVPKPKRNKFNAQRSMSRDGLTHASKFECAVYEGIKFGIWRSHYEILKLQNFVKLGDDGFKVDFLVWNKKEKREESHEAKGMPPSDRYKKQWKLWHEYGPRILKEWNGDYKRPFINESRTVVPNTMKPG